MKCYPFTDNVAESLVLPLIEVGLSRASRDIEHFWVSMVKKRTGL